MCPTSCGRVVIVLLGSNGRPISGAVSYVRHSNDAHDTSNRSQSQSAALLVTQRV